MTWLELTTIIFSVAAFGGMIIQWRNGKTTAQTGDASAARDIGEAYHTLVGPLEKRVVELESKLALAEARANRLEAELALVKANEEEYQAGIRVLLTQIVSFGERPLWKPKDSIG